MYENEGKFELYDDELNTIIERAYSERRDCVEWEQGETKFKITFSTMKEERVGAPGDAVAVRRFTNGEGAMPYACCACQLLFRDGDLLNYGDVTNP